MSQSRTFKHATKDMFVGAVRIGINDKQTHPLLINEKLNWNNTKWSESIYVLLWLSEYSKPMMSITNADKQTDVKSVVAASI